MHSIFLGMTESGKSTLVKILSRELVAAKKSVAVYDPIGDSDWGDGVTLFDTIEDLVTHLKTNRNVFAFVDESGAAFDEGRNHDHLWLVTQSRHYGHSVGLIAQRMVQIPRTMRDQCGQLFLFTSSRKDGKEHAEEWSRPELESCSVLPQFHFFQCRRYGPTRTMKITDFVRVENADNAGKRVSKSGDRRVGSGGGAVDTTEGS